MQLFEGVNCVAGWGEGERGYKIDSLLLKQYFIFFRSATFACGAACFVSSRC